MQFILGHAAGLLAQAGDLLRRPEVLVFLPALTLASFWLGGEEMLTIVALGLPMVFVMTGAIRRRRTRRPRRCPRWHRRPAAVDGATRDEVLRLADFARDHDGLPRRAIRRGRTVARPARARGAGRGAGAVRRMRMLGVLRQGDTLARLEGGGFAVALGARAPARPRDHGPARGAHPGGVCLPDPRSGRAGST